VDFGQARHKKDQQRKEQKVEQMQQRFGKALGMEQKKEVKGGLWKLKQKKKKRSQKPGPQGW
jgi:hypothetical protein